MHSFIYKIIPVWITILLIYNPVGAQTVVPFDSDRWEINSRVNMLLEYQGKQALYLHNGEAALKGASLKNGIIEFDIAFSGERGFTGIIWRKTGPGNFEDFYIRPHQSGQPDANQYTPVFNGVTGWQLYHGEGYGSPLVYPMNQWIHVKLVFWEDQAQVFIDDMDKPAVQVPDLKHETRSGEMGLRAFLTPVYFSEFSYQALDEAPFQPIPLVEFELPEGMISGWEISTPFKETRLEPVSTLKKESFSDLGWQRLESEATGIANLARLHGIEENKNTVFARLSIRSDGQQFKKLRFGYSDRVKVYANGQPVYGGDNTYTSRDYRYLGTIGLFDEVYLPLQKGDNEVLFAVTEAFGGWGIMAQFDDLNGIQIQANSE